MEGDEGVLHRLQPRPQGMGIDKRWLVVVQGLQENRKKRRREREMGREGKMIEEVMVREQGGREVKKDRQSINQSHILNTSPRQEVVLTSYSYRVQQKHFTEQSPYT